jgi:beta-lactamase class A
MTRKMKWIAYCLILFPSLHAGAQPSPKYSKTFSAALQQLVKQSGLDSSWDVGEAEKEQVSFAVIDITGRPTLGGVNMDNFIYPASVYKIYVAMEILKQVSQGEYPLNRLYVIKSPNDVDRSREISFDPRPLLKNGDTVTINYLLDLMITRSDNSAANCLIDIAGRKNINKTMQENGWQGSEVTRKFLKRALEDPGYDSIRGTQTNARHAADFMYKVATNQLVNPWVSLQMKALLGRQLDKTKLAPGLPANAMFSHKTGWWSFYTNDVGIVEDGKIKYVIALFTPVKETDMKERMKLLAEKVHALMMKRHK